MFFPVDQVTVAARKGLCQVVCNYAAMTSMVKTLGAFRTESQLVARERASGLYSCFSFYTAKVYVLHAFTKERGGTHRGARKKSRAEGGVEIGKWVERNAEK